MAMAGGIFFWQDGTAAANALAAETRPWKRKTHIDLPVNVALLTLFVVPVVRAPVYVTTPWKHGTQVEQQVNLAVRGGAAPTVLLRPSAEPTFTRRLAQAPELFPNIALMLSPSAGNISTFDDLPTRKAFAFELFPNLSVGTGTPPTVLIRSSPEPTSIRHLSVPESFPNLAVNLQTQVTQGTPEPTFTRKLTQVELFPNLAISAPAALVQLNEPIEPWTNKRYPPPVEVFQNQAIYAPAESRPLPAPIEPTYTIKWAYTAYAPDVLPNLAVAFDNVPIPTTPVADQPSGGFWPDYGHFSHGRGGWKRRHQQIVAELAKITDTVEREIATLLHQTEAEAAELADLHRLQQLVQKYSRDALEMSDRAKIAYVRALTQANFSALEALDRELQRMLEEEEVTALMLLLNDD